MQRQAERPKRPRACPRRSAYRKQWAVHGERGTAPAPANRAVEPAASWPRDRASAPQRFPADALVATREALTAGNDKRSIFAPDAPRRDSDHVRSRGGVPPACLSLAVMAANEAALGPDRDSGDVRARGGCHLNPWPAAGIMSVGAGFGVASTLTPGIVVPGDDRGAAQVACWQHGF